MTKIINDRQVHEASRKMPSIDQILAYENGEMDDAETIEFFQELVDSGAAWSLQGCYGRMAMHLIRAGLVTHARSQVTS